MHQHNWPSDKTSRMGFISPDYSHNVHQNGNGRWAFYMGKTKCSYSFSQSVEQSSCQPTSTSSFDKMVFISLVTSHYKNGHYLIAYVAHWKQRDRWQRNWVNSNSIRAVFIHRSVSLSFWKVNGVLNGFISFQPRKCSISIFAKFKWLHKNGAWQTHFEYF